MRLYDTGITHRNPNASADLVITAALLPTVPNEVAVGYLKENIEKDIPWLVGTNAHNGVAVVTGSGPSLADCVEQIRELKWKQAAIFSCNNSANYLTKSGIDVDTQVLLDPHHSVLNDFCDHAKRHLIASICPPALVDKAKNPTLWHPLIEWVIEVVDSMERDFTYIGGGITVTVCAAAIAYTLGFREIHMLGVDSSFRDGDFYADGRDAPEGNSNYIEITENGRIYRSTFGMKQQAIVFLELAKLLKENGCQVYVHGSGLLPDVFNQGLQS